MITPLLAGSYYLIWGFLRNRSSKTNHNINKAIKSSLSADDLPKYLNQTGTVFMAVGVLIISIGQVEHWYNPHPFVLILGASLLGAICLAFLLNINKKYLGRFIPRWEE
ncbi:hypothetical protein [Mesobacillus subterraneus]|uniref:DUF3784 domain-containing protein n=1 Tax=Mesobacillus subterraneus TaxID=285983 RepID=A0A3R9FZD6_9BACI|nr:hypothetical protein [Mesobacillus subterraneus]RSD28660.1 hypothetical protein EJA10_03535 [Mesobacillus subterraneus]